MVINGQGSAPLSLAAQEHAVQAALQAQSGTLHDVPEASGQINVTGLVAGLIAVPAGVALHRFVLPVMGHAAQTALPPSALTVYGSWEVVLLGLSGLVIAAAGALAPAGWAARAPTAAALRAE